MASSLKGLVAGIVAALTCLSPLGMEDVEASPSNAPPSVHFDLPAGCELVASDRGGRKCWFQTDRWDTRNLYTSESSVSYEEINKLIAEDPFLTGNFEDVFLGEKLEQLAQGLLWGEESLALSALADVVTDLEDSFRFFDADELPEGMVQCLQFNLEYTKSGDPNNRIAPGQNEVRINSLGVRCLTLQDNHKPENKAVRLFFLEYNELRPTLSDLSPTFYTDAKQVIETISLR